MGENSDYRKKKSMNRFEIYNCHNFFLVKLRKHRKNKLSNGKKGSK